MVMGASISVAIVDVVGFVCCVVVEAVGGCC